MNNRRLLLLLVPLLLLMQSCTGMLVYFIEEEIVSSTKSDFNLDQKQSSWVRERVNYHISDFRSEFLPGFINIVEQGNQAYQDKLTVTELNQVIDSSRDHIKGFTSGIFEDLSHFFKLISPEQYAYYKKNHQDQSDFDIDIDDDNDHMENTKENVLAKYKKMYGHLEPAQEALISKLHKENPNSFDHDLKISLEKATFFKSIAAIIKSDLTPKQEKQSWVELFSNPDKIYESLAFNEVFESIKRDQRKFVDIDATMSDDQRQHFSKKIKRLTTKVRKYALQ